MSELMPYWQLIPNDMWNTVKSKHVTDVDFAAGPSYIARKHHTYATPVKIHTAFQWLEKYRAWYRACYIRFEDGSVIWLLRNSFHRYDLDDKLAREAGFVVDVGGKKVILKANIHNTPQE